MDIFLHPDIVPLDTFNEGAQGCVYLVRDSQNKQIMILKSFDICDVKSFNKEVKILEVFKGNPGFPQIYSSKKGP